MTCTCYSLVCPVISKEALNNSSVNYQSKNKSKCDFDLFFIFNNLAVIENGDTSLCRGTSEFFRGSLSAC